MGKYFISLDQILGSGTFSKVYLGEMEIDKLASLKAKGNALPAENKYAVKQIANQTLREKLGPKGQDTLNKEIHISKLLVHPNIVRLYDIIKTENNNYLVFEFCGGGDLRGFLKEKRRLSEPVA